MGIDATNFLPATVRVDDVVKALLAMGYSRWPRHPALKSDALASLYYFQVKDYQSYVPVEASLWRADDGSLRLDTRTMVHRSRADTDKHNETLREIRRMFGGHFVSEAGRNRYLKNSDPRLSPAASGCLLAYRNFESNLGKARIHIQFRNFPEGIVRTTTLYPALDPELLSNNLVRVFLASVLDDYLKSTFVALLTYADKESKRKVLKQSRLADDDLIEISAGHSTVELAVASQHSFQNLDKALKLFEQLDQRLKLHAALVRPYRRRKETLLDSLKAMVRSRNSFIHENDLDIECTTKQISTEINNLDAAIRRVRQELRRRYGWPDYD